MLKSHHTIQRLSLSLSLSLSFFLSLSLSLSLSSLIQDKKMVIYSSKRVLNTYWVVSIYNSWDGHNFISCNLSPSDFRKHLTIIQINTLVRCSESLVSQSIS